MGICETKPFAMTKVDNSSNFLGESSSSVDEKLTSHVSNLLHADCKLMSSTETAPRERNTAHPSNHRSKGHSSSGIYGGTGSQCTKTADKAEDYRNRHISTPALGTDSLLPLVEQICP